MQTETHPNGIVQVRVTKDDGTFYRFCVTPAEVVSELPGWNVVPADMRGTLAALIRKEQTPERVARYAAQLIAEAKAQEAEDEQARLDMEAHKTREVEQFAALLSEVDADGKRG